MKVRALKVFAFVDVDDRNVHMNPGDVRLIENLKQAQQLIANGFAVEVEMCPHCGSHVEKQ